MEVERNLSAAQFATFDPEPPLEELAITFTATIHLLKSGVNQWIKFKSIS